MPQLLASLKAQARLLRAAVAVRPAAAAPSDAQRTLWLGSTPVQLHTSAHGAGGISFINVHEDEQTAVQAARAVLRLHGARLIELRAQGSRLLSFRIGWSAHTVDPNRIFSDAGLAATLRALGPDTPAARQAVRGLRDALLALLPPPDGRPIVALHNNGGDYSVLHYRSGGRHAAEAARVHLGEPAAARDFFIVTEAALFDPLAADGFNVVLQSTAGPDDGSLSVWAQRAGRPYVNVEAGHGRLAQQQRMLEAVLRHAGAPGRMANHGMADQELALGKKSCSPPMR